MLVSLGFQEKPTNEGFPTPTIIASRNLNTKADSAYGVETKADAEAYIDARKTVGERAATKRSPGNWS